MTNNNALELLPAKIRQGVYVTYGLVVIVTGATQVGYAAVENLAQPVWLTVALAVVAFLGVPISALAASNVVYVAKRELVEDAQPRLI